MATLLLMRHAKAVPDDGKLDDHDRPLNRRGRDAATAMAQLLLEKALVPDAIVCSSSRRTLDTLSLVLAELPFEGSIAVTRDLYLTDRADYLKVIAGAGHANRLLLIGHNPTIEYLFETLAQVSQEVPTAAIAHFEVPDFSSLPSTTRGTLLDFWCPREID